MGNYRCNYKCYFNSGCYGFSLKSFSRQCTEFPSPPKYSYKLVGVSPFKADWSGIPYNCLNTCSEDDKNPTFDDQSHIESIGTKAEEYETDLKTKVEEWKVK